MPELWEMEIHEFQRTPEATWVPRGSILSIHPRDITPERLAKCTGRELEALCLATGIPHSGKVETLVERIRVAWGLREFLADATQGQLKKLPARAPRRMLRSVGQSESALNRYAMAGALIGWRDQCRLNGKAAVAGANHYVHVRRAVRMGLPVPAEVLRLYPDLTAGGSPLPLFDRLTRDRRAPIRPARTPGPGPASHEPTEIRPMGFPTDERRREMVDRRVIAILEALPPRDESMEDEALIAEYLADEWACLEVAARVIAPAFGLDALDERLIVRLQRAMHAALKAECLRAGGTP